MNTPDVKDSEEKNTSAETNQEDLKETSNQIGESLDAQPKEELSENWPFTVERKEATVKDNEVIKFFGKDLSTNSSDVYMGQGPRNRIESKAISDRVGNDEYFWLGYADDNIKGVQDIGVSLESLHVNMSVFGLSDTGKTTFLQNLLVQYAYAGFGFCFIDPKGEDTLDLIRKLPESRLDDIIFMKPGEQEFDRKIGFNIFETDYEKGERGHENEVQRITEMFTEIVTDSAPGSGGSIINDVTSGVARQMIKSEKNYNPIDFHQAIFNEDQREALPKYFGDEIEREQLEEIAEQDDDELKSTRRRINKWVIPKPTREIIDVRETSLDFKEILEDGKILIVNTSEVPDEKVEKMLASAILRRIWSAAQKRDKAGDGTDSFFTVVDEFDSIAIEMMEMKDIMSQCREYNYGITLATQNPSQVDGTSVDEDVFFQNANSILTYRTTSNQDARTLAKNINNIDADSIKNLAEYTLAGSIQVQGDPQVVEFEAYAPYPPLRTVEEAKQVIQRSLQKYGEKKKQRGVATDDIDKIDEEEAEKQIDDKTYGIFAMEEQSQNQASNSLYTITEDEDIQLSVRELLLYAFQTQKIVDRNETLFEKEYTETLNGEDEWITKKQYKKLLENKFGELKYNKLDEIITEDNNLTKYFKTEISGEIYFKVNEKGLDLVFEQDTGEGADSGRAKHRHLIGTIFKTFSELGYEVNPVSQDEGTGDKADVMAHPPIKPYKEANVKEEVEELELQLRQYERLYELYQDKTLSIEAETSTQNVAAKCMKNLKKSLSKDKHGILVVLAEPSEDRDAIEAMKYNAEKLYSKFRDPPFAKKEDDFGDRTFYKLDSQQKIELANGGYAVMDEKALKGHSKGQLEWEESQDQLLLTHPDENVQKSIAHFSNKKDIFEKPMQNKFNYNARHVDNQRWEVYNENGTLQESYQTKKELKEDGWFFITPPLIPSVFFELEDNRYPKEDEWDILVKPDSKNQIFDPDKLYKYDKGAEYEFTELISGEKVDIHNATTQEKTEQIETEPETNSANVKTPEKSDSSEEPIVLQPPDKKSTDESVDESDSETDTPDDYDDPWAV